MIRVFLELTINHLHSDLESILLYGTGSTITLILLDSQLIIIILLN